MNALPRERAPDSTTALLREGYAFAPERSRRLGTDIFRTRIMLRPAWFMQGAEASEVFYHPGERLRHAAEPPPPERRHANAGQRAAAAAILRHARDSRPHPEPPMQSFVPAAFTLVLALALPAGAEPLPAPTGEPVLTIAGNITEPNAGDEVVLDLEAIGELGSATIETTTDWEWQDGKQTFRGVPLMALLDAAGATGDAITLTAADEYSVTMSLDELARHEALLATELNGQPLTEDSFGPLWLVFPYDKMTDPQQRKLYTDGSVWSLVRIDID